MGFFIEFVFVNVVNGYHGDSPNGIMVVSKKSPYKTHPSEKTPFGRVFAVATLGIFGAGWGGRNVYIIMNCLKTFDTCKNYTKDLPTCERCAKKKSYNHS